MLTGEGSQIGSDVGQISKTSPWKWSRPHNSAGTITEQQVMSVSSRSLPIKRSTHIRSMAATSHVTLPYTRTMSRIHAIQKVQPRLSCRLLESTGFLSECGFFAAWHLSRIQTSNSKRPRSSSEKLASTSVKRRTTEQRCGGNIQARDSDVDRADKKNERRAMLIRRQTGSYYESGHVSGNCCITPYTLVFEHNIDLSKQVAGCARKQLGRTNVLTRNRRRENETPLSSFAIAVCN